MVDDAAHGIDATNTRASVYALGVQARLLRGTVTVEHALGATADVGIAKVALATNTGQASALAFAVGVWSAL